VWFHFLRHGGSIPWCSSNRELHLQSLITHAIDDDVAQKRITRGLVALREAKGKDGPSVIAQELGKVGGVYSQTSISLWLNGWRIPCGDARTHIRLAYGVAESLWMVAANGAPESGAA
jgi:hypothetical protein